MIHTNNHLMCCGYVGLLLLYGSNALRTSQNANRDVLSEECGNEADFGCIPGAITNPDPHLIEALSREINGMRERSRQSANQCQANVIKPRFTDMGLGAAASSWVKVFLIALQSNMTVATPDILWPRFEHEQHGCASKSLSCLIRPFSNCDAPGLGNQMMIDDKGKKVHFSKKLLRKVKFFKLSMRGTEPWMPQSFAGIGVFWFISTVLDQILRPSDALANQIARLKQDLGFHSQPNQPVLAVHMRRGDSCKKEARDSHARESSHSKDNPRTCHGPAKYFEAAQEMQHRHGFKSMYVATDDQDALESLRRLAEGAGWKVMSLPFDEVPSRTWGKEYHKTGQILDDMVDNIDAYSETLSSLLDVHLMAAAEGFVGRFDGNLGNVAYALMAARTQALPPRRIMEGSRLGESTQTWCLDYDVAC